MLEQQLSLVLHNGVKQVSWERKCLGQFFIEKNSDYKVSPSRLRNMSSYEQKPTEWQRQIHQPVSGDIQSCVIIWGTSRQHVEQQMVCTSIPPIKKLNTEIKIHMSCHWWRNKNENQLLNDKYQVYSQSPLGPLLNTHSEFLEIPAAGQAPAWPLKRNNGWMCTWSLSLTEQLAGMKIWKLSECLPFG